MPVLLGATTARRSLAWGVVVIAVTASAYVAGAVPSPARVTVDHCYVTYDSLERQHSRCVGHWNRAGFDVSGPVHGVPVDTRWQALSIDPDDNYEWEVAVPDSSRRHDGLTLFTYGWVVPRFGQLLLAALAAAVLAVCGFLIANRLRRRRTSVSPGPEKQPADS